MARQPRYILPGQPQHIIQRGNNRQVIFNKEQDYRFYQAKLKQAAEEQECHIHAYVQMTNHVHLLITPQEENSISKMMQVLGRYYVQYFNYRYNRTGTLFEGRYKATLINSSQYLFTCMRYIELNPVRAGIVSKPSDYKWSSYLHNAEGEPDILINTHPEYNQLAQTVTERQRAYAALFNLPIDEKILNEIRESSNKGWVLGSSEFKKNLQEKIKRPLEPKNKGGDRRSDTENCIKKSIESDPIDFC